MVYNTDNETERKEILKKKAQIYYSLNLKCHIKLKPYGFTNCKIVSQFIEDGQYWMVLDVRGFKQPERLFIDEVFDIKDYEEVVGE